MLRLYTFIMGVGLLLLSLAGLLGIHSLLELGENLLFLATAPIFLYAGFSGMQNKELRTIVGGMGALYLLSGILVIFTVLFFGEVSLQGSEHKGDLIRAAVGIVCVLAAWFLPCQKDPPAISS